MHKIAGHPGFGLPADQELLSMSILIREIDLDEDPDYQENVWQVALENAPNDLVRSLIIQRIKLIRKAKADEDDDAAFPSQNANEGDDNGNDADDNDDDDDYDEEVLVEYYDDEWEDSGYTTPDQLLEI